MTQKKENVNIILLNKKLVEDYDYNPFYQVPVVINSSTGLFDNYYGYTTSSSDFNF